MGEDVTPEEPPVDEADAAASRGPAEAEVPAGWSEPTEADFAEAGAASERARVAAQRMSWRRRTASGAILSGLALGFQQVFEDKKQDVSVVVETSGEPPTDLPVEAELEGLAPRRSVVRIRPWLLGEEGEEAPRNAEQDAQRRLRETGGEGPESLRRDADAPDGPRPES